MANATPLEMTRRWLQVLADTDYEAWASVTSSDLVIHTPFVAPGMSRVSEGRETCLALAREYGKLIRNFRYLDVELHTTDDPELIIGTARSEAVMANGGLYANQYCVLCRVKEGRVVTYTEYSDPLVVMAAAEALGLGSSRQK
jgi:ketosteroid isomerase-like protein